MTAEEAEDGLVAADIVPAWRWLEERRLVVEGRVVKMVGVC